MKVMVSYPKRVGVDALPLHGAGYFWEPIVPALVYNRNGVNDWDELLDLPSLRGDWLTFAGGCFVVVTTTFNAAYTLAGAAPVDSQAEFYPSGNPLLTMNGGVAGLALIPAVSPIWNPPPTPAGLLHFQVIRPTDILGNPTGVLTWNVTLSITGIYYIRSAFQDFVYA
jgi:hypothetical protein